ncbi:MULTISPECIES: hypothetical protein [Pseudomonas]|uniref:hypothetical protein n=1 Tax=Pseudomonas TaxID=286 RepID=UPI00123A7129|nr:MULTISPECIES: hypothetical protein [Pseudomonas]QIB50797.1 hypothetical protein G3M63_06825 [Pseudomonas sp. OIL-1]
MLKQLLAYRNLLFILILLNSEVFFLTDDKKAGIPFLRELYLLGVIAAAGALFVTWRRVYQSKTALWIVFLGLLLPVSSAVLANLNYGQPLVYGLLEERRSFMWLSFFVALLLLIKTAPSQKHLEKYFLYSALFATFIGFMYYLSIIPDNASVSFAKDEVDWGNNPLRPNRYRIGSGYVTIAVFMLLYQLKEKLSVGKLALVLYFAAYLWLVIQTRGTMVIWALAALWIFRNRIDSMIKVGAMAGLILVASFFLIPEFWAEQIERFNLLFEEATTGPGVRDNTIATILQAIKENNYIGKGALSLQWNEGFHSLYNPHFYLSDVGIVGVYHRYGFLTPFIAVIFYGMYLRIMSRCKHKGDLLAAFQLSFMFSMFNMLLSNSIMYGGDMLGITTACFLYYSKVQATETTSPRQFNRVSNGPLQYRNYKLE